MNKSELRRYLNRVYRLAQLSTEAATLFLVIQHWFRDGWQKDFKSAIANEDLLRIIATSGRLTAIVKLHVVCDNGKQGKRGHNVFKLVAHAKNVLKIDTTSMLERLSSVAPEMRKLAALRNNVDAHSNERDEWKLGFGGGFSSGELRRIQSAVFFVILECGKELEIRKLPFQQLVRVTKVYGERLVRALNEQAERGEVGVIFTTVRDWEEEPQE